MHVRASHQLLRAPRRELHAIRVAWKRLRPPHLQPFAAKQVGARMVRRCVGEPLREVAVSRWRDNPDDVERLTIELCAKHLRRLEKARKRGHRHLGQSYRTGFW